MPAIQQIKHDIVHIQSAPLLISKSPPITPGGSSCTHTAMCFCARANSCLRELQVCWLCVWPAPVLFPTTHGGCERSTGFTQWSKVSSPACGHLVMPCLSWNAAAYAVKWGRDPIRPRRRSGQWWDDLRQCNTRVGVLLCYFSPPSQNVAPLYSSSQNDLFLISPLQLSDYCLIQVMTISCKACHW